MRLLLLAELILTVAVAAQPAPKPYRLPQQLVPAVPMPAPASAGWTLTPAVLLVIDSDAPLVVISSPAKLVSVTHDPGPLRIRGTFVDSKTGGKPETRTYSGKHVYTIDASHTGAGELIVLPVGASEPTDRIPITVEDGAGPRPPPGPGPQPTPPTPTDDPLPGFPVGQLRVLIVEETAERARVPAAQLAVLFSAKVRDYLDAKCAKEPDGRTAAYRIWDKDVDAKADLKVWQDGLKRKRDSLPWLICSNGTTWYEGPVPANTDEALKLLKKYGGE